LRKRGGFSGWRRAARHRLRVASAVSAVFSMLKPSAHPRAQNVPTTKVDALKLVEIARHQKRVLRAKNTR
jgi:hypothetical protein